MAEMSTMLPVPPTNVPARSAERILIAPLWTLLICTVHVPDEHHVSVQALLNLDNAGPHGIEHRIIAKAEPLPVLLINYENKPVVVRAVFHCIDARGKSVEQLCCEYQQWFAVRESN